MVSLLSMVNIALAELGEPAVASVSNSPVAAVLSQRIADLLPQLLMQFEFSFAVVFRKDNTPLTQVISDEFLYNYALPGDFGKIYRPKSMAFFSLPYEIMNNTLCSNQKPVEYYYITKEIAYESLPDIFADALAVCAASRICFVHTNNSNLTSYIQSLYQRKIAEAVLFDSQQNQQIRMPADRYARINYV